VGRIGYEDQARKSASLNPDASGSHYGKLEARQFVAISGMIQAARRFFPEGGPLVIARLD